MIRLPDLEDWLCLITTLVIVGAVAVLVHDIHLADLKTMRG